MGYGAQVRRARRIACSGQHANERSFSGGDVAGAWLYTSYPGHGLSYCVAATTVVGLLLVPLVLMIPRHLTDTSDGDTAAAA